MGEGLHDPLLERGRSSIPQSLLLRFRMEPALSRLVFIDARRVVNNKMVQPIGIHIYLTLGLAAPHHLMDRDTHLSTRV